MHAKVWRWKGKIFDDVKTSFSQHLLATFMDCDVGELKYSFIIQCMDPLSQF